MARGGTSRSLAEQLADLDDPAPKDLDPEDDVPHESDNDSRDSTIDKNDESGAREHYSAVEHSKLRKSVGINLGPQYKGSSVSRNTLDAAESDDDPFGGQNEGLESGASEGSDIDKDLQQQMVDEDENEAFAGPDADIVGKAADEEMNDSRSGSNLDREGSEEDMEDIEDSEDGADAADNSDDTSISDEPSAREPNDRAPLRKMMAGEQKSVADLLSKAAKEDVAKGKAIKHQRATFDALLNTRIKLQKALISTNSMRAVSSSPSEHTEAIQAAETAALNLWNTLSSLRLAFHPSDSNEHLVSALFTKSSSALWTEMQSREMISIPTRRANLTKWSQKTNPAAALSRTNKFSQTPSQQPLTSALDQHLSGSNAIKIIAKTRVPRSCAPVQAAARVTEDADVYDDTDFYSLLLRELVDQRMTESRNAPNLNETDASISALPSQRDFKVRKPVDRKASKGRKMRYAVHEKLQNFMALEDRGSWGERQRTELFGSLLGRKVHLGENLANDEDAKMHGDMNGEGYDTNGQLRLFG